MDRNETTDGSAACPAIAGATKDLNTTASGAKAPNNTANKILCVHCQKRNASKDCPDTACSACCTASALACPKHAAVRAKQNWRQLVLQGRTPEQLLAAEKRKSLLPKHSPFKESGFRYTGDTVVIWNIRDYYANPKWRVDARRRSNKRRNQKASEALVNANVKDCPFPPPRRLYCSRKRFRLWVEQKYQEANNQTKNSIPSAAPLPGTSQDT